MSILSDLSETERDEIVAAAKPQQLKIHDILAQQGAPAMTYFVVEVGYLRAAGADESGKEIGGRTLGPGRGFGGSLVLGRPRYVTSARALQPVRVLGWSRALLMAFLDKYPPLRQRIAQDEAHADLDARERMQESSEGNSAQRLARTLIQLSVHGVATGSGVDIVHPLTRQDLADLLGTDLFEVTPLLAEWETLGVIATTRSHVRILKSADLKTLAGD